VLASKQAVLDHRSQLVVTNAVTMEETVIMITIKGAVKVVSVVRVGPEVKESVDCLSFCRIMAFTNFSASEIKPALKMVNKSTSSLEISSLPGALSVSQSTKVACHNVSRERAIQGRSAVFDLTDTLLDDTSTTPTCPSRPSPGLHAVRPARQTIGLTAKAYIEECTSLLSNPCLQFMRDNAIVLDISCGDYKVI
jgi:hypothetical protein